MIKKNDLFEAEITAMTAEGSGICRADGMAVFVPGTAVGDRCVVRVVKVLKKYAFGRLEELLTTSPDRTTPDCPIAGPCGGCVYRHITYEAELKIKTQRVRDALERIGGFENIPMEPILGAPSRTRYRNKCQLPIGLSKNGEMQMGFYAVNSHRIIDTHTCLLQPEVFDRAAEAFRAWQKLSGESIYDEAAHSGVLRHLYMRCGEKSGEVLVCIVANGAKLHGEDLLVKMLREAVPEITGIVLNINRERTNVVLGRELRTLWGKPTIRDTLCRLEFEISPHAFYQVNRTQAEALYNKAQSTPGLQVRKRCLTSTAAPAPSVFPWRAARRSSSARRLSPPLLKMPAKTPRTTMSRTPSSFAVTPKTPRASSTSAASAPMSSSLILRARAAMPPLSRPSPPCAPCASSTSPATPPPSPAI